MPTVKNIGKRDRMVADYIMRPGEIKYVSPKKAMQYANDPDFEIVDETPVKPAMPEVRTSKRGKRK